jgi:hypothetical protein
MIGLALLVITISALSAAVSLGRIESMLRKKEKREQEAKRTQPPLPG